jgi:hypothetical protein
MRPAGHWVPHVPQLARSVWVFTQLPLQLLCPVWHCTVQTPAEQTSPDAHCRPQAPQLLRSLCSPASQPLLALLSQLAKPVVHAPRAQVPLAQVAAALAKKQGRPQPPQCVVLVVVLVSQPLTASPSQLPKPVLHMPRRHTPPVHDTAPLDRVQAWPQPPQFARLVEVSTSQPSPALPLQSARPVGQVPRAVPQVAMVHTGTRPGVVVLHTLPQVRQLLTAVLRLVSQPFSAMPSQLPKPELQVPSAQRPLAQVAVALGKLQVLPHAPQWVVLVLVLASQPLPLLLSQLAKPALQEPSAHALPTQLGALLAKRPVQVVPHALQLFASFVRSRQVPEHAV